MSVRYILSASSKQQWPTHPQKEVAFLGRSNCGKSSLLNALSGTKIAHISSQPGKTKTLNFFSWNKDYHLVDVPGYGYAAQEAKLRKSWQKLLEDYLLDRENLGLCLLLMDSRRKISQEEEELMEFLRFAKRDFALVFTKTDKLKSNELRNLRFQMKSALAETPVFFTSSPKRKGLKELEEFIFRRLVAARPT